MVAPPPGVSSTLELAVPSPRRTLRDREPEPDAVAVSSGRRGAGTAGRPSSLGSAGCPGPRSTTRELDRARATARAAIAHRRSVGRRRTDARCRRRSRPPARAARRRPRHRGSVSGTSTSHAARRVAEALRAPRATTSSSRRLRRSSSAPVWSRLMSSRLPTRWSSRSVSSSIGRRAAPRASSGGPGHVGLAAGS